MHNVRPACLGDDDAVFRDFIKIKRDSIVHEYATAMTDGPIPVMAIQQAADGPDGDASAWLDENLYRPMGAGKYDSEDGTDVPDLAISSWESQLDEVERRAT